MAVQFDLIIPPVIVGLLVIVVFQLNSFIMETSVDNRLNNDMQTFADLTSRLIQEEVKSADQIYTPAGVLNPDTALKFYIESVKDTVWVQRSGRNLEIIRQSSIPPSIPDTIIYPSSLSSLEFEMVRKPPTEPTPYFLKATIVTESDLGQHATVRGDVTTVRGFSENEIYLRNIHAKLESASP